MTLDAFLFFGMIGFLSTHELDAVQKHEWRVLPLTSWMSETVGRQVFVFAHVPLFFLIIWIVEQGSQSKAAMALSTFAVVHVGLHWAFRNHPKYEFLGFGSRALIVGAGVLGLGHILSLATA